MNNKQRKINKRKENQKVGYWAWIVAGLKGQESGLLKTKKKKRKRGKEGESGRKGDSEDCGEIFLLPELWPTICKAKRCSFRLKF